MLSFISVGPNAVLVIIAEWDPVKKVNWYYPNVIVSAIQRSKDSAVIK